MPMYSLPELKEQIKSQKVNYMKTGAMAVIIKGDKVLLVKREDLKIWAFPGGEIEKGEYPIDTAVREAREETGLSVSVVSFIGWYMVTIPFVETGTWVYRCTVKSGRPKKRDAENTDIRWFKFSEAFDVLPQSGRRILLDVLGHFLIKGEPQRRTLNYHEPYIVFNFIKHKLGRIFT